MRRLKKMIKDIESYTDSISESVKKYYMREVAVKTYAICIIRSLKKGVRK